MEKKHIPVDICQLSVEVFMPRIERMGPGYASNLPNELSWTTVGDVINSNILYVLRHSLQFYTDQKYKPQVKKCH